MRCPTSASVSTLLKRDDDGIDGFGFTTTSELWRRAPSASSLRTPPAAMSPCSGSTRTRARYPASGSVTSASFLVPAATGGTHLNFHHAYVLDWFDDEYYDGGQVVVSKLVNGAWTTVSGLPWVNGPNRHIYGSSANGFTGFGGDSRGYGSSELDLSSLAGQTVRVSFRIGGDEHLSDSAGGSTTSACTPVQTPPRVLPRSPRTLLPSPAPPSPGRSRPTSGRASRRTRSPGPTERRQLCRQRRAAQRSRGSARLHP